MARIAVEIDIDEEFLADARAALGTESDEETLKAAVVDAAKRLRRQEFFDAIDSGKIDLTHDARNDPGQGRSAA
ncbi:type II toxin-antitoxin system VapB family antitoxin [Streptomyces sp. A3M-1-3]|uniref:type II toxin-antitoxin system VapB family antitoxin n=1 Tax=Streptomyces sp. A3M-1-3 TaxID=2962044 RepID=UPI0020B74C64|nr:type II toxin-antitoxin system VapB family antitoxin [Streptomyces sp. A3M-1-3]MCP3817914.1 type II toxin-antitoxin system VapB family antitoxin [Streptomyces sp. A3M-1-3]